LIANAISFLAPTYRRHLEVGEPLTFEVACLSRENLQCGRRIARRGTGETLLKEFL
jgi:hypothetical protein